MAKNAEKKVNECIEKEEVCFHNYVEHLKRLQGGDYKKPSLSENRFSFKYPTGSELAAFLDIGAEAERRNEVQFQEMKCCIDKLTKENDCLRKDNTAKNNTVLSLQKKIAENEKAIMTMTTEIEHLNCGIRDSRDLKNYKARYNCEREQLLKENEEICCQLQQLRWKFNKLNEEHSRCSTNQQELEVKDCQILKLTECINEKEAQIQRICRELKELKEKKCELEVKLKTLEDQLQSQYDEFADKSTTYQKAIDDLESQVNFLEQTLTSKERDLPKSNPVFNEIICQTIRSQEAYNANQISERDRVLQELIAMIELRDRNVMQLSKLQNATCLVSDKEYDSLMRLIDQQACEIERLTQELQSKSIEDTDSMEILNEVTELQNAVSDSIGDHSGTDPLARRIKRIKCKIKSRLQREEARRKELCRQLGIYRCQFVTIQKEIDELRQQNTPTSREDIKCRMEKEKALSQIMSKSNYGM